MYLALGGGPPGFRRDSSCPALLGVAPNVRSSCRVRGSHPLWPAFPCRSPTMNLRPFPLHQEPVTPRYPLYATLAGLHVHSLGSSPFARRYLGNHCCFLFLGVLRCFSSPGAFRTAYGFSRRSLPTTEEGFPHSDTLGSTPAYGSPRHFGVRPVLLQHLAPRHPPCALPTLSYAPADVRRMAASPRSLVRSRTQIVRSLSRFLRFLALLAPLWLWPPVCAGVWLAYVRPQGFARPRLSSHSRLPPVLLS